MEDWQKKGYDPPHGEPDEGDWQIHLASLQLAAGANVVQLSRALGHHSAAFTLDVYAHLLDGEDAPALDLSVVPPEPIRLRPVAERDVALHDHYERTRRAEADGS